MKSSNIDSRLIIAIDIVGEEVVGKAQEGSVIALVNDVNAIKADAYPHLLPHHSSRQLS